MKSEEKNTPEKNETFQNAHSLKFLKKRKFLMLLPILIFPFASLLFMAMKENDDVGSTKEKMKTTGLNPDLPDARPQDQKGWNKLDFYEQADKDSVKWKERINNDPYYRLSLDAETSHVSDSLPARKLYPDSENYGGLKTDKDENEEKVYKKLAALNAELGKVPSSNANGSKTVVYPASSQVPEIETPLPRLVEPPAAQPDTELNQVNRMLDKIMDIQHPERIRNQIMEASQKDKTKVYQVGIYNSGPAISYLGALTADSIPAYPLQPPSPNTANRFYASENDEMPAQENSIPALIHETQTVVSGSTVKLRLSEPIYIAGQLIAKDQFVYGLASLNGDRLEIQISTIRFHNSVYPVSLSVYDLDGLPGIYIPGAITRDALKKSSEQSIQGLGLTSLNPNLGVQAAGAGIEAAKNLLTQKVKLVRVSLKAGYQVLLKDTKADKAN